jgi:hypothetical protein
MAKQQKTVHKKKMGRPPGKRFSETIPARLEPQTISAVEAWAVAHDVSRSEAIRRLVELGLTVKSKGRPKRGESKQRARDLAGFALDEMSDTTASAMDQASRKRRLIKGPSEFRDDRVDHPKANNR